MMPTIQLKEKQKQEKQTALRIKVHCMRKKYKQ